MANNQARSDGDFQALLAEVYEELVEVVGGVGTRIFESSVTITTNGSTGYTFTTLSATDHMHTIRVARVLSDNTEEPLAELMPQEEWRFKGRTGDATHYTIVGSTVALYPAPASGSYKLYYVGQPTDISSVNTSTSVDCLCSAGYRLLVWGTAALAHGELEGNALMAVRERDRALEDLQVWAANRHLLNNRSRVNEDYITGGEVPMPGDWP